MKKRILAVWANVVLVAALLTGSFGVPLALSAPDESAAYEALSPKSDAAQVGLDTTGYLLLPRAAPTPSGKQLARFDEASGVFSVHYPTDFRQISRLDSTSNLFGYAFSNNDATATLAVGFLVMSDTAMADGEWSLIFSVLGPEMLIKMLGAGFDASYAQTAREEGEGGAHTLYWEGEATESAVRCAARVEESEGVLAIVALAAPSDQWAERQEVFSQSLGSLVWSPDVAREQSGSAQPTAGAEAVTEVAPGIEINPSPGPDATPADDGSPDDVDTLELSDLIQPTATPEDSQAPDDTDTIVTEETPASSVTITFEDPEGVFTLIYPAEFDNANGPSLSGDNYTYAVWIGDGASYLGASFSSLADEAISDDEWDAALEPMVESVLSNVDTDASEVYRSAGDPGEHWIYVEAESDNSDARAFYYLEEAKGVLAILMAQVPRPDWPDWESRLLDAVNSFSWSSDAARQVLAAAQPNEPEPTATSRPKPRPTKTPAADSGIPAGKGGLVMLNCRSDVVTVDVIPDAIFQELAPKQGEQCHRGAPIFLNPGDHILKASIAGVASQGEATVTIVAGQWFEFTWN